MTPLIPPTPNPAPYQCGICRERKEVERTYIHAGKFGTVKKTLVLCQRCDLTPDPPKHHAQP